MAQDRQYALVELDLVVDAEDVALRGADHLDEAAIQLVRLYRAWAKPDRAASWSRLLGLTDLPADVFANP